MKKKSNIPKFKTYEEEAHFWDTHSFTEFADELEEVEVIFDLKKPRTETVVVRLQKNLKDAVGKMARTKGLDTSSLIRSWIMEKVQASK